MVSNCITSYNFASYVKDLLYDFGLNYVWDSQFEITIDELLLLQIRQRLEDQTKQELWPLLNSSSKCSLFKFMVSSFNLQFYLGKNLPTLYRKHLPKFRLSSHNLLKQVAIQVLLESQGDVYLVIWVSLKISSI